MNIPVYQLTISYDPTITTCLWIAVAVGMITTAIMTFYLVKTDARLRRSNDLLDEIADLLCDDPDDKDEEDIPMPESNIVPMHHYRGVWGIPPHGTCHEAVACDRTPQEPSVGAPPAAYRHRITHERTINRQGVK